MSSLAPIVLFVYNRPDHTRKTLRALADNLLAKESSLFIYADGPKENATDAVKQAIAATREVARAEQWCKEVKIIEFATNRGLASSIIAGVTEIVNQFGKIIVLEDDLVTSPYFLTYMNDGLNLYENNEQVISMHGFMYPGKEELPDYFFLRGADCWGWATWKRGWDLFNPDAQFLLDEMKRQNLQKLFNFDDSYNYTEMLQAQIDGKVSSWAIRWYASAFLADKYTLYPAKSFVENIGFDGSGTHCGNDSGYATDLRQHYQKMALTEVTDSPEGRAEFVRVFTGGGAKNASRRWRSLFRYIIGKIRSLIA